MHMQDRKQIAEKLHSVALPERAEPVGCCLSTLAQITHAASAKAWGCSKLSVTMPSNLSTNLCCHPREQLTAVELSQSAEDGGDGGLYRC
jgi:hypothetical protein